MNLIEKLKRWWAPGEYDDERGPSDGEGFALSGDEHEGEQPTTLVRPEPQARF
jgi:hypothetical protein